jgi:uncharacterized protein YyaL (SSP411 family)
MKTKINWLEWGKEAFERAGKEDKPILLDLTAVWCHWCHVMDATSYSDSEVIEMVNGNFVPVKVYIDRRPDIRERYNMGGFPSTVFLDSAGNVIAGDTYIPPQRLKIMLKTIKAAYKKRKDDTHDEIGSSNQEAQSEKEIKKQKIKGEAVQEILLSVEDSFDSFYGGFGLQPKFPSPEAADFLFMQYKKTNNKKHLDMAIKTLDGMHNGIYDKTDFGFFRYSVTQDWKTPHYEKMLDTNAGLLRNYAVAYSLTKNKKYKKVAEETIAYINNILSNRADGGFYGSQDADEEFYLAGAEERKSKKQPYVDKTIYVDWNSMMVSSYIKAGAILNSRYAVDFAIKTADFILEKCHDKKKGLFHFFDGEAKISGLLGDNIYFLNCLIDVYETTKNLKYLKNIKETAEFILKNFYDDRTGGFFDRVSEDGDLGALKRRDKQFMENSFCANVFLRMYFLTDDIGYKEVAENTLLYFSGSYLNFGYFAAMYAAAVDMLLNQSLNS